MKDSLPFARETTIERLLKASVLFNGILIPPKSIESTLARWTLPLVVINDDEIYPCSLMGSSIAVKHKGRYFLICCRHQLTNTLAGRSFEDVGLLDVDGHSLCSAGGIRFFDGVNDSDLHDLVVFDFTEPCKKRQKMQERFLTLEHSPPEVPAHNIVAFIVSGYPFKDQNYEMSEESRKIDFRKRIEICGLAAEDEQPADKTLLRIKPKNPFNFDPDGMSGGAAFTILLDGITPRAYLAGLLVRAGREDVYLLKIGNILQMLETI